MIRYITVDRLRLILETSNPNVLDVKNLKWKEVKETNFIIKLYAKVIIPGSSYVYLVDINDGNKLTRFRELINKIKEEV